MDKSGVVKKSPAGGNDNGCSANMPDAVSYLNSSQNAKAAAKASAPAPDLGMDTNAVSHAGEPHPKGQSMK